MDQFEKLLQQEKDTDEKHSAAAEFFTGLKKESAKVSVRHNRGKKLRAVAREDVQKLLKGVKSGPTPKLSVKPPVKAPKATATAGQAIAPKVSGGAVASKYKKLPKQDKLPEKQIKKLPALKKKMASPEEKELLTAALIEKRAYFFTAAARGVKSALKGGGEAAARAGAAGAGAKEALKPEISRLGLLRDALKRKASGSMPTFSRWGSNISKKYQGAKRGVQNFMDPNLAKARTRASKYVDDYKSTVGPRPTNPQAAKAWDKGLAAAEKKQADFMKSFEFTRKAETATGAKKTGQEIWGAIKGPDGKVSPSSVYKGLEGLGLTSPEAVLGMGTAATAGLRAASKSRAAAKAHNQKMMLLAGAGGLGTLALLKGSKQRKEPQVIVR